MSDGYPLVPLATVAQPVERPEAPEAGIAYRQVGVRLWGEGAYERETIDGSQTKYATLSRVETDDIIVNKIWARNGSVAVVSSNLAGAYVSGEFPTFAADHQRLDPRWVHWLTKTEGFWNQCDEKSRGTSGKNRIRPERFLEIAIPLPPIAEQRRIVARIEALAAKIAEARGLRRQAIEEIEILWQSATRAAFISDGETTVGDYASVQSGYAFKSEWFTDSGIRLVRNVNIGHGSIDWQQTARISSERHSEFARFNLSQGDILISLDRPIISTGVKVAQVKAQDLPSLLLQRVGRVQFKNGKVYPEYMFAWLRSPAFISAIDPGRSNGVPHISQKDIERITFVPPSLEEQQQIVAYLDDVQAKVNAVRQLQAETAAELDALLPAVLHHAFRGELA